MEEKITLVDLSRTNHILPQPTNNSYQTDLQWQQSVLLKAENKSAKRARDRKEVSGRRELGFRQTFCGPRFSLPPKALLLGNIFNFTQIFRHSVQYWYICRNCILIKWNIAKSRCIVWLLIVLSLWRKRSIQKRANVLSKKWIYMQTSNFLTSLIFKFGRIRILIKRVWA